MNNFPLLVTAICAAAAAAIFLSVRNSAAPRLGVSVAIGLVLRIALVIVSKGKTPGDTSVWFHQVGTLVNRGIDPLLVLRRGLWNFFPMPAYFLGLAAHLPIAWDYAEKLLPVACDVVIIIQVFRLTGRREAAFLYAACPIALLVSGVHGQLEPIALVFALAALLASRRNDAYATGALIGLAVAAKTWPVAFLPGLLHDHRDLRSRIRILGAAGAVLAVQVATWPLAVQTSLRTSGPKMLSHAYVFGNWGWAFLVRVAIGYHTVPTWWDVALRIGLIASVAAMAVTLVALWNRPGVLGIDITNALILVFALTTPAMVLYYLGWALPTLIARLTREAAVFIAVASVWLLIAYLRVLAAQPDFRYGLLSLPVAVAGAWVLKAEFTHPRRHWVLPESVHHPARRPSARPI